MSVNVKFTGDAKQLEAAQKKALAAIEKFEEGSAKALNNLTGNLLKGRGAMVALAGSAVLLKGAVSAAVDFEKLNLGLRAVADESENVEEHIARLKQLAKNPGLGFEQAQKGSIKLQGVGFQIQQTERILQEFGNAVALSGNGAPELERITTQLGQLAAKGKVLTQDLRPIIEAAPVVSRALKSAFGTVSADDISKEVKDSQEFIQRLLDEMAKLPRAPKSAAESFQNMRDSAKAALAEVGAPIVKELVPVLDNLVKTLDANEETLQNFGKALAFVITTAGKLSPILGAVATAYVAVKAAQIGGNLAGKLGAQVAALKARATAIGQETKELNKNTAAQRANKRARAPRFKGKATAATLRRTRAATTTFGEQLPDSLAFALAEAMDKKAGKVGVKASAKAGLKAAKSYSVAFGKSLNTQGGALGVSAVGAIATAMIPESHLIGGKAGSSMLDGISGALALAGPIGIGAALTIQAAKAGYALGQVLADAIYDGAESDADKVRSIALFTQDYFDAVNAGDTVTAMAELTAKREEFVKISKEGDAEVSKAAKQNIELIDLRIAGLDKIIAKRRELKQIVAANAAKRFSENVEDRSDISATLKIELELLSAKASGNKQLVAQLEREKRIAEVLAQLEKEGNVRASERLQVAVKIVNLQDRAKAAQKRQNELAKEALEVERSRARAQSNMQSLLESSLEAYKATLPLAQQLELLEKQRAALQKSGGGGEALDVFRRGDKARQSGEFEEAERLYKIGQKLLDLDQKRAQLKADQVANADAAQNQADTEREFKLEQELLDLKLKGDEAAIAAKEREIALLRETQNIESQLGISREEALLIAEKRLDIQQQIKNAEKAKRTKENRADFATELKALELEASGRKKEADALREKAAILARSKDLQDQLGVSAAKALELARKEAALKKQIEQNESNRTTKKRGIKRDTSGFGSRDRSIIDRVKRTNDGDLTSKIRKNASLEKAAQSARNDPALSYLAKLTEGNAEMIKIWRGIGVV